MKARRVALYVRVSTSDQTTENQERELRTWADRAGHIVVEVFRDEGISGTKGRDKRPGLDALLKAVTRRQADMIAAWSVDRLGRSMTDLLATLQEVHGAGADMYLHTQALDTSTPSGKAMFQMLGVFAEFERSLITERVHAGIARARDAGKHMGRPKTADGVKDQVRELLSAGMGKKKVAATLGIGVSVVQGVAREVAEAS